MLTIEESNISPPPSCGAGTGCRYIEGIGKVGSEVKLLLKCETLFSDEKEHYQKIMEMAK